MMQWAILMDDHAFYCAKWYHSALTLLHFTGFMSLLQTPRFNFRLIGNSSSSTDLGATENAGVENAGAGSRGGKGRSCLAVWKA